MDNWTLGVDPTRGKVRVRLIGNDTSPIGVVGMIYNRYGLPYLELTRPQERRIRRHFGIAPGYGEEWGNLRGDYQGIFIYIVGAKQDRWPECDYCFRMLREDEDIFVEPDGIFCDSCYHELYTAECQWCQEWFQEKDVESAIDRRGDYIQVCTDCLEKHFDECHECNEYFPKDILKTIQIDDGGVQVCPWCLKKFHCDKAE